jgi:hypothetical protein
LIFYFSLCIACWRDSFVTHRSSSLRVAAAARTVAVASVPAEEAMA